MSSRQIWESRLGLIRPEVMACDFSTVVLAVYREPLFPFLSTSLTWPSESDGCCWGFGDLKR